MHTSTSTLLASLYPLLSLFSGTVLASDKPPSADAPKPCTVTSPTTGSYFDLGAISLSPPEMKDGQKVHSGDRDESWHARGHDYPANFTLNICAPVIEELEDVVGVEKSRWQNVSAYYELNGKIYSIGQQASSPIFRGRKLVLNYTDGSPCPDSPEPELRSRKLLDDDDDDQDDEDDDDKDDKDDKDEDDGGKKEEPDSKKKFERRKSTMMSFLCDRDLSNSGATVSFVGTMDSCTYVFDIRSAAACGGVAANTDGGLGPAGVFGVIAAIAIAAYLVGGCAYQRTVLHQRGWRQCPNYTMWAGAATFLWDLCIILFSSLGRCLRLDRLGSSRGYSHLSSNGNGANAGGRGGIVGAIGGRGATGATRARRDVDEENRLIDQLDEEWED